MNKFLFNLFIAFTFLSCQSEKIDIPNTGRKIVVNSLLSTNSAIGVNITTSAYPFTDATIHNPLSDITNAKVVIYENNSFLDSLHYLFNHSFDANNNNNNYRSQHYYPKPGYEYIIKVNAPGKPEITAKTTIPGIVKIEKVDTSRVLISNPWWKSNVDMIFDIRFNDPVNEKNYYLILGGGEFSSFQDPATEVYLKSGTITSGIAYSDKSFNGQQHNTRIIMNGKDIGYPFMYDIQHPPPSHKTVLYIKLYSITEEYFKYIQDVNLFLTNYNNPLAKLPQVFSNVQGGYGIFEGAAVSCDSIVFY